MAQGFRTDRHANIPGFVNVLDDPKIADADPIRTNFVALWSMSSGPTAPGSVQQGTLWYDNATPTNHKIKIFDGVAWRTLVENVNSSTPAFVTTVPTFVHTQGVGSSVWQINHGLNKFPGVTVVNSVDEVVIPDKVIYLSATLVRIEFFTNATGKAYLN